MIETIETTCDHCGSKYIKPIYDLDLNVGDKVTHDSWHKSSYMKDFYIVVENTTYKKDGLYFGTQYDASKRTDSVNNYRIDTRNKKMIKLPANYCS